MIDGLDGGEVSVARSDLGCGGAFFEAFLRAVRVLQGRPVGERRRGLDGVFWIARTGSASCALPEA